MSAIPTVPARPSTALAESPAPRSQFMFRLMHRGMRRDAAALVEAVAQLDMGHAGATALRDWFVQFAAVIDHHHRIEDDLLWRSVSAVRPEFEDVQLSFADEHDRISLAADEVVTALDALVDAPASGPARLHARRASRAFEALVGDHVDREQFIGLPAAAAVFDAGRMLELDTEARRRTGIELVTFLGPWMLDHATPDEIVSIIDRTPAPIAALGRTVWRRRYERSARQVRQARTSGASSAVRTTHRSRTPLAKAGLAGLASIAALTMTVGCGSDAGDVAEAAPAPSAAVTTSVTTMPMDPMPMDSMPMSTMPMDATTTVAGTSPASTTTAPGEDTRLVRVSMTDFAFTLSRSSVPAGPITFDVTNDGAEGHQMMVGRLHDGETVDSFLQTYATDGEPAAMALVDGDGGLNGIVPGASGEAVSVLSEGNYIVICYLRDATGTPHLMKGMTTSLEVTAATDGAQELPAAISVVTVRDYAIEFPVGFEGKGMIELHNIGQEAHELTILQLAEGKTFADVAAWFGDPSSPRPFAEAGGIGAVAPGGYGWATMDLAPGNYVSLCFVPTADGTPHVMLGMAQEFSVS